MPEYVGPLRWLYRLRLKWLKFREFLAEESSREFER